MELTHFDENGKAIMVDISAKKDTGRTAEAEGTIFFNSDVADAISKGTSAKGDVIGVATVAGIMSAKRTWELIPMCHNIPLGSCQVIFDEKPRRIPVQIAATQDAGSANAATDTAITTTIKISSSVKPFCLFICRSSVLVAANLGQFENRQENRRHNDTNQRTHAAD